VALSNYATAAFDSNGAPCAGEMVFGPVTVEIYKNWVYVRDAFMANRDPQGWGFQLPTVMHIDHGELQYGNVKLYVARGTRQHAVFVYAEMQQYPDDESAPTIRRLCGVGCTAHMDYLEFIEKNYPDALAGLPAGCNKLVSISLCYGRTEDGKDDSYVSATVAKQDEQGQNTWTEHVLPGLTPADLDADAMLLGVTDATMAEFLAWLETLRDEYCGPDAEYITKIRTAKGLQFNQGDAFFARHLDAATPAIEVGQLPEPTVLSQLVAGPDAD